MDLLCLAGIIFYEGDKMSEIGNTTLLSVFLGSIVWTKLTYRPAHTPAQNMLNSSYATNRDCYELFYRHVSNVVNVL